MQSGYPEIHVAELEMLKEQASKTLAEVEQLTIGGPENHERAQMIIRCVESARNSLKNAKWSATHSLIEQLQFTEEFFRPIEEIQQKAEKLLAEKMRNLDKTPKK